VSNCKNSRQETEEAATTAGENGSLDPSPDFLLNDDDARWNVLGLNPEVGIETALS
jgi:hypothetical protein